MFYIKNSFFAMEEVKKKKNPLDRRYTYSSFIYSLYVVRGLAIDM